MISVRRTPNGAGVRDQLSSNSDPPKYAETVTRSLVVQTHAGDNLDGDDRRDRPINDKTEGRPPACVGNKLTPVLPEILKAVPSETGDKQPRCACDRRGGDDDENAGNTAFDSENGPASIGTRETDVDRGDHH